jgi:hypothetical protein
MLVSGWDQCYKQARPYPFESTAKEEQAIDLWLGDALKLYTVNGYTKL